MAITCSDRFECHFTSRAWQQGGTDGSKHDDRPDDSNALDTIAAQFAGSVSPGQRVKGAMKNAAGELIDDDRLREGERENQQSRPAEENDAV